jgi:hypothetical protein
VTYLKILMDICMGGLSGIKSILPLTKLTAQSILLCRPHRISVKKGPGWLWDSRILLVVEAMYQGVTWPCYEAHYSPPSSVKFKIAWMYLYTSIFAQVLMAHY